MLSSQSDLSEKLQGAECYKLRDDAADVHSQDTTAADAQSSEKIKNVAEGSKDAQNMLPSSPTVRECENTVDTEDLIEDNLDGLHSWVVVCASFVNCFIVGVMFMGFSILYVEISEYFYSTKAVAGWVGSLYAASGNMFGIFFSVPIGRYGCRIVSLIGGVVWFIGFASSSLAPNVTVLYFTYGIVAGMGFNIVRLTSFVIVQQHFKKFRALAAAISQSGQSVGALFAGPLLTAMLSAFQLHGTLLLMSAMVLNSCVFGALYRPPLTQSSHKNRRHQKNISSGGTQAKNSGSDVRQYKTLWQLLRDLTDLSLFSNTPFTLVCIGSLMTSIGFMVFTQHTPSRAVFLGIEHWLAYLLPTVAGVALFSGRIIGGIIGNFSCTNRLLQYGVSTVISGVLLILLGNLMSFIHLAMFGAATGFVTGCFMTIQTTLLSDLVGVKNIARAQAFLMVFVGVGALISVPLAGFIYDCTNDYNIPFYMGGTVEVLGGFLSILAAILKRVQLLMGNCIVTA